MRLLKTTSFLIVFICILSACNGDQPENGKQTVHDFRLDTLDHGRFYFNEHRDKLVVLVFWGTYCRQCKVELRALNEVASMFSENRVRLAAVCTDPENISLVRQIAESLELSYPVLLDSKAKLSTAFQLQALPTTVLLGTNGEVAHRSLGYNQQIHNQLVSKIQFLLDNSDS